MAQSANQLQAAFVPIVNLPSQGPCRRSHCLRFRRPASPGVAALPFDFISQAVRATSRNQGTQVLWKAPTVRTSSISSPLARWDQANATPLRHIKGLCCAGTLCLVISEGTGALLPQDCTWRDINAHHPIHSVLPAAGPGTCWGGVRARVYAYVLAFASTRLYSVFRPGQTSRASASVSSRVFGRRGVAVYSSMV